MFTAATLGVPLIQVPPGAPLLLNTMVEPTQTLEEPLIVPAFGIAFTAII